MAIGTAVYPGYGNTFVRDHKATGNLVISFSRNPKDFPLTKYVQYREVQKMSGFYLKITAEEAARIVGGNLSDFVWPDGADRPRRHNGLESFAFADYRTQRYDYDYTIGYLAAEQADWNIHDSQMGIKAQQAMTGRTVKVQSVLTNTANWDSTHYSAVASIAGNTGSWEVSTIARQDIKRSINFARNLINKDTLGVVKKKDLILVFNPTTATKVGESQEIVNYVKSSPEAWSQVRGDTPGQYAEYGLPDQLYGVPIVVEDTVVVTSARGAASLTNGYAMSDGKALLLARPGGLVSNANSGPSFSTAMLFLKEEMTTEKLDDKNNRRTDGHIVDDFDPVMTAPVSGFMFTSCIE